MVAGTRPGGATRKPVRKYSTSERHCTMCGERLSAYNPGPNCFVHSTHPATHAVVASGSPAGGEPTTGSGTARATGYPATGRLAVPLYRAPTR